MNKDKNQVSSSQDPFQGTFVETSFTNEQVVHANAEERLLGIDDSKCAFLGDLKHVLDVPVI